ncbi:diguanylate cyclase domain-containing protein [Paraburkholderia mimosarum]|uniref:diguanylate cyclase domain-containing protein n=1 Tax=Paraburkholderia mimosarum TaxID=312026 RepID=UPI0039C29400
MTPTLISRMHRWRRAGALRALVMRVGLAPAALAGAALFCLLAGLVFLALQIRVVLADELKQEYTGLVLEAIQRTDTALNAFEVLQRVDGQGGVQPENYRRADIHLAARLATLSALVDANPDPTAGLSIPRSALLPDAGIADTKAMLVTELAYWRAQRDGNRADMRMRLFRVADTLIVMSVLVISALITSLGMYAKRTRELARESREFKYAALHDSMTGLPNRRTLFSALGEAVTRAPGDRMSTKVAVLYIDLDGFKGINDALGHRAGDDYLVALANRFRQSVRLADVVARIGGDEFAVLVREFSTDAELGAIAHRLMACVVQTAEQMGVGPVSASIGIASFPDSVKDYRRLVAAADETMYQVKRNGKSGYGFAAPAN